GFELLSLSFDYGQRHLREIEAAHRVADFFGARHTVVKLDTSIFQGSALTDDIPVPKEGVQPGIPVTYVPARNLVFISFGIAFAENRGARDLFIGVNAVDYSGYPDCRPQFIDAIAKAAALGTKCGDEGDPIRIHAPIAGLSKSDIILKGAGLSVDYSITHSCYDPDPQGRSCGLCDSCRLRLKGFADAGLKDPVAYVNI
ncbi:MAG: 7-cyano-7-deazaguanine synthase QueC, partial [bacterium]